ncbi:MAG TPA: SirB2 family protein [Cytophagaceae bacterium]|nr:SirB2 family protein [Cytophagaceae bacterium]
MAKGFLHLHITVVTLFLLLYTVKTVLLLMNRTEQLDKLRAKTKIADMVLGSLMLITGGYLLTQIPAIQSYHYVKIIVALSSIPIGIIAFKKRNKALASILLVLFVYVYGVAETKSLTFSKPAPIEIPKDSAVATAIDIIGQNTEATLKNGEAVYNVTCVSCHGNDGKRGVGGAKDLTASTLSHNEKVDIITNGKGLMTPFKGQLSAQDIESVASFVDSMKK